MVRDEQGRKMSKSLGNSPEPLDLIAEYGADAVRFTTLYLAPLGQDVLYSAQKNEIGRNFANKIWNAGRFLLMNRDQIGEASPAEMHLEHLDLADRWILSRLHSTVKELISALAQYEINKVSKTVYDFFWHDYCDWYVEMIKSRLYGSESAEVKKSIMSRALDAYEAALKLLHPFMPFVTEELWQSIRKRPPLATIMHSRIIEPDEKFIDHQVEREMAFVQSVIEAVRNIRGEMGIPPAKEISVVMKLGPAREPASVKRYDGYFQRLARVRSLEFVQGNARPRAAASAVVESEEIYVPLEGLIDISLERTRLKKEIDRINGVLSGIRNKLNNVSFVEKAPKEVVGKEREKLESFE
ncbi:MAG: class I tRNA ligase family protein, partial [Terriglobia bacterium]